MTRIIALLSDKYEYSSSKSIGTRPSLFIMKYFFVIFTLMRIIKSDDIDYLVVGKRAQIKDFPHSALLSVMCFNTHAMYWQCGASIVNQGVMLTAAHCVQGCTKGDEMSVSVGSSDMTKGIKSRVTSFYAHVNFDAVELDNDIALLKLKTDLKLNHRRGRVALMKTPPYTEKALVAGWGLVQVSYLSVKI